MTNVYTRCSTKVITRTTVLTGWQQNSITAFQCSQSRGKSIKKERKRERKHNSSYCRLEWDAPVTWPYPNEQTIHQQISNQQKSETLSLIVFVVVTAHPEWHDNRFTHWTTKEQNQKANASELQLKRKEKWSKCMAWIFATKRPPKCLYFKTVS